MRTGIAAMVGCWVALAPMTARAHPAVPTSAEATITADGRFRVAAHFDTLAFVLNDSSARIGNEPMEALLASPPTELAVQLTEAKGRFLHGFRVTTDHGPGRVEDCRFPTADEMLDWKTAARLTVLPVELPVYLSGRLPTGAGTVAFRFPGVLDQIVLTVDRPGEEPFAELVEAGAPSSALPLGSMAGGQKPPPNLGAYKGPWYIWPGMLSGGLLLAALGWHRRMR